MGVKVVFIGNPLGGDDGIGPRLFAELQDDPRLSSCRLLELGVVGLDLISYVEPDDHLIIVDAVKGAGRPGEVILLSEEDLRPGVRIVSQHDFGVEETAAFLHAYLPRLPPIHIVGIAVSEVREFSGALSEPLERQMPQLKEKVVKELLRLSGESGG